MVDFLKHEGTTDRERDSLKMSVKTICKNKYIYILYIYKKNKQKKKNIYIYIYI